jgi:hypothetical protein
MPGVGWFPVSLVLLASVLPAAAQATDPYLNVTVRDSRGRIVRGLETQPRYFSKTSSICPTFF